MKWEEITEQHAKSEPIYVKLYAEICMCVLDN